MTPAEVSYPTTATTHTPTTAVREIGWIAREATALVAEHVPEDSPRWAEYLARKRALLAYIEARG